MAPYGSARADWNTYPKKNATTDVPSSPDAPFVDRVKATIGDLRQSYEETMQSVARIADEWRTRETTPRDLERLARLIFHTMEPGDSWAESPGNVKELYRDRAETLLESGYRRVDR
ncbi:hypothetical protein [Subtercola sp. YIM 133946]|uniref:hypothetical protein n=1 Tax=Subtercola sp. YIM 133946 TaxID=3118909 RepID=UPI002F91CB35